MPSVKINGIVKAVGPEEEFGSEGFRKRTVLLECFDGANGEYVTIVPLEFTGDKAREAGELNIQDQVTVDINIRSREWTSPQGDVRYFVSLNAWRFDRIGGTQPSGYSQNRYQPPPDDRGPVGRHFTSSRLPPAEPDGFRKSVVDEDEIPF
jgi:hypothetical protein